MENNIKETPKIRFAYLDNVRSLVIILVIAMHTAVTYSGLGDWYYIEGSAEKLSIPEMVFFGFFQSFLQAWFMGILFFISAFLAAKTLAKRGELNFMKERLFRLGLPLLIYVFIISPFIMFVLLGHYSEISFSENYIQYVLNFGWLGSTGPLWFVQVLLVFCIIYASIKLFISKPLKINNVNSIKIVFAIILTTIIAFLVRLVFPIGSSYLNLQFSYFPSYIVMFIAGVLLGENNLLENITDGRNIKWLKLTILIGIPLWAATMVFGGALEGKTYYNGGFYWQNFTFALWESFTAIGFSIGIIALFRKNLNIENKFTRLMRDNAFGIYCFHAPILIAVSLALEKVVLKPILKFTTVFIFVSIFCLFFSFLMRKIKPIGILFK
jgi:surface polysaccharide O-acyltransferase-like enzyme